MYECKIKISEKLAALRTDKGVTQEEIAQVLSISDKTVSKWETGASMPDITMLVKLAEYYGVTTDTLLGLSKDKNQSFEEKVSSFFESLDRKDSAITAFEVIKSIIPVLYNRFYHDEGDINDKYDIYPQAESYFNRSVMSCHDFFDFIASSENVNVAVMMLQNEARFAWLKDINKQKETVKLFKLLSSEDVLSVFYFINSTDCSECFTSNYIANNTGINNERAEEILDGLCSVGTCTQTTAYLSEGETKIYKCYGDEFILALISLAFERMCGVSKYDYNLGSDKKMIGGNTK